MFQWMESLAPGIVAQAVLAMSIVAAVGLALGSLGFRGIRLGTAGVLFVFDKARSIYTTLVAEGWEPVLEVYRPEKIRSVNRPSASLLPNSR